MIDSVLSLIQRIRLESLGVIFDGQNLTATEDQLWKAGVVGKARILLEMRDQLTIDTGGDGGGMPTGAIGLWYPDEVVSSPRYIPNHVAVGGTPVNILNSTRYFASGLGEGLWSGFHATITDGATGPTGGNAGTIATSAADWYILRGHDVQLPAGTYTIATSIKRNAGSDQSFLIYANTGSSVAKTATSSWTRVTHTFTVGSPTSVQFGLINNGVAAELLIADFELYVGLSDLGPEGTRVGHLMLGWDGYDPAVAVSSGALDMSTSAAGNNPIGFVDFDLNIDLSLGVTLVAIVNKTSASSSYVPVLSKGGAAGYGNTAFWLERDGIEQFTYSGSAFSNSAVAEYWTWTSLGWHARALRYDLTTLSSWVDGVQIMTQEAAVADPALKEFYFGNIASGAYGQGWKYAGVALFNRPLSDAEILTAQTVLWARAGTNAITQSSMRLLVCEGDSVTSGSGQYFDLFKTHQSPANIGEVLASFGANLATYLARAARFTTTAPKISGSNYIYSILLGNDLPDYSSYGGSRTTYLTALAAHLDAVRTAGFHVTLGLHLPRTTPGFNTERNACNAVMAGWVGTHCDSLIRFDLDATMGPDAAASDTGLYSDGIHPTSTGQDALELVYRAAINAI